MENALRNLSDAELTAFELIETFGFRPGQGFVRLNRHLDRMARSAAALGLPFDKDGAQAALAAVGGDAPLRVRLALRLDGQFSVTTGPLAPNPPQWRFAISEARLDAADPWLGHKTTRRWLYDATRAALPAGVDEALFLNTEGALCEGTITNLFVQLDGALLTPPLAAGLLPGVLRGELLATGKAREADLRLADLVRAEAIFFGNSLRGLIPAQLIPDLWLPQPTR